MSRSTPEEIRRRIAKRKKEQGVSSKSPVHQINWPGDEDHYDLKYLSPSGGGGGDEDHYDLKYVSSSGGGGGDDGHPLFKKEVFFFKILASALLFLAVAILFRNHTTKLNPARDFITSQMDKDFKFAVVSNWYEEKFGKPLALLPFTEDKNTDKKTVANNQNYAVPAMGKILENFEKNGQGIMIETGKGAAVQAINDGLVTFAGVKDGIGKTVIIQHSDQSETWYGNLDDVKVKLYEYVNKRTVVGTVSTSAGEDKTKGKYYFAIKKGDQFIDPIQVIRFE
ncbi:M23 family metallopeptidase [Neobacillus cucumis]|uniref:M23 family metallopeptidase n=1 Tax=Neobacillus cucumis TaxID=1740721 RepID=UPI002E24D039|nr:M23 family metallopeptidase [Neobacillus cucumis]